jgi:hypothetical protein
MDTMYTETAARLQEAFWPIIGVLCAGAGVMLIGVILFWARRDGHQT